MSVNIMDLIKGAVSDQLMGKLGGMIGLPEKKASSVFETAAGSILGGLMKKASSPQGAQDIFKAVQGADTGVLDKLGDLLGGQSPAAKSSGGILDLVFGSNQSAMIGTLSKFLGLDNTMIGKLLAFVAPLVMGVLGKQVKTSGLNAAGLGSLLGSQKNFLGKSMPAELTKSLGFADMLGSAGEAVKGLQSAAQGAGQRAMAAADNAASGGGSILKFLIPIVLLAALAFFGYKYLMNPAGGNNNQTKVPVLGDLDPSKLTGLGDFDLMGLQDKFKGISDGLQNVTAENVQGLASKISGLTSGVDSMGFDKLGGTAKSAVGGVVSKFVDTLKASLAKYTDEGILSVLKPVIDGLIEKLKNFII